MISTHHMYAALYGLLLFFIFIRFGRSFRFSVQEALFELQRILHILIAQPAEGLIETRHTVALPPPV